MLSGLTQIASKISAAQTVAVFCCLIVVAVCISVYQLISINS